MFSVERPKIRRMTNADIPDVKTFLQQIYSDERDFYESYYPIKSRIPIVIAEQQGRLIGAAAVYHNSLHPYWVNIMVTVAEDFRKKGLGRKLHEAALQARPLQDYHLGIQGCYYQGNEAAEAFLFAMGYQLRLDCYCIDLNIENFDFTRHLMLPEKAGLSIVSFTELFLSSTKQQEVCNFLVSRYSEEHFWSPPQPKDYREWQEIVFDGVRPELSFALIADGKVVGGVSAGVVGNDTLDMIWGYISRQYSTDDAVSLLKCLLAHQFRAASDQGLCKAEVEIDTTDVVYSSLLNWLPSRGQKVWRILQRPRTPFNHSGAVD